jgi:hypothetical protein
MVRADDLQQDESICTHHVQATLIPETSATFRHSGIAADNIKSRYPSLDTQIAEVQNSQELDAYNNWGVILS